MMDTHIKQIVLCIVATLVARSSAQFAVVPTNTYGIVGGNVTLDCATDSTSDPSPLFWGVMSPEQNVGTADAGDGSVEVYPNFVSKYTITRVGSSSTFRLTVMNVQLADSGQYRCTEAYTTSLAYAEVIVLESDETSCTESSTVAGFEDNVEGEMVNLECVLTFSGLWGPIQDWSWNNGVIISPNDVSDATTSLYENSYTTNRADSGKNWVVETRFPAPPEGVIPDDVNGSPSTVYSRVTPTFSYTYTSEVIIIYYGTSTDTMSLSPIRETYIPGDTITCAAEGHPDPTLKWVDQANNTIENSGRLLIDPSMEGLGTYRCLAENEVRGNTIAAMAEIIFNVTIPPTTTSPPPTQSTESGTDNPGQTSGDSDGGLSDGAIAGIVLGVLAFLVILAVILFFCCVRKAPQKKVEKTKPAAQPHTDHIRAGPPKPVDNLSYVSEKQPPSPYSNPYNPYPYNQQYAIPNNQHSPSPYDTNNLHYADLALDDTPRSRKPIQLYTQLDQLQA